jgi:hypothetical protein
MSKKTYMTKREVLVCFRVYSLPHIPIDDIQAKREGWNNLVESLAKDKIIPPNAYSWENPFQ